MPRMELATIRQCLQRHAPRDDAAHSQAQAAVAIVLREMGDTPEALLIRRAEHPDDPWSGHMAFPGGRRDEGDTDLLDTAWRETHEEIGLDVHLGAQLIGRLDDTAAIARGRPTGMLIRPFIFELAATPRFTTNYEVEEVVWAPLARLASGEADTIRPYKHESETYELPAFDVDGRVVWGLTYHMLCSLLATLKS